MEKARQAIHILIKENPEHKETIEDFFELFLDTVEEGGSHIHEWHLMRQSLIDEGIDLKNFPQYPS
jgi:hypothetical protein